MMRGKRVKALPEMESPDWSVGGMVDQTLTPEAEAMLSEMAGNFGYKLGEWFRNRIGYFRSISKAIDDSPPTQKELRLVQDAQRAIHEAMRRLENLPPSADAYVNLASWLRDGRLYHGGLLRDFLALGNEFSTLLGYAEQRLDQLPKKPGRKSKIERNELLTDTAEMLRNSSGKKISEKEISILTFQLLTAAGIDLPKLKQVQELISKKGGNIGAN
ncbi:hypothetical protein [Pseudomonas sp.]|uniref:hypothetical protein n=1 Tax=Pseudomonas sp. TaxID=306 RepID=UPI002FC8F1D6